MTLGADSGKVKSNSECHFVGIAAHHTLRSHDCQILKNKRHLLSIFTSHLHFWLPTCFSHIEKRVREVKRFPLQPQCQLGSVAVFQMFVGPRARPCKHSCYSELLCLLFRGYNLQQFHLCFCIFSLSKQLILNSRSMQSQGRSNQTSQMETDAKS